MIRVRRQHEDQGTLEAPPGAHSLTEEKTHEQMVTRREPERPALIVLALASVAYTYNSFPHHTGIEKELEFRLRKFISRTTISHPPPYTSVLPSACTFCHRLPSRLPKSHVSFLFSFSLTPTHPFGWPGGRTERWWYALGLDTVGMTQLLVSLTFFLTQTLDCGQCRSSLTL